MHCVSIAIANHAQNHVKTVNHNLVCLQSQMMENHSVDRWLGLRLLTLNEVTNWCVQQCSCGLLLSPMNSILLQNLMTCSERNAACLAVHLLFFVF